MKNKYLKSFDRRWFKELKLSANDKIKLEKQIDLNPGVIIKGTDGVKKVRFSLPGKGKRGGIRVCYYYYDLADTRYFILAYNKKDKENLTNSEVNDLFELVQIIKSSV